MESIWLQILTYALPSGFLGSVVTWLVTGRRRRNDFLAEMQKSIDMLSEKYNAVLQDNIMLRQEKAEWKVTQKELLLKVDKLTREVENLRRNFNRKQKENGTNNQVETPYVAAPCLSDDDGVCGYGPNTDVAEVRTGVGIDDKSKKRKRAVRQPRRTDASSGGESDGSEPDAADGGGGCACTDGAADDSDAEPP